MEILLCAPCVRPLRYNSKIFMLMQFWSRYVPDTTTLEHLLPFLFAIVRLVPAAQGDVDLWPGAGEGCAGRLMGVEDMSLVHEFRYFIEVRD